MIPIMPRNNIKFCVGSSIVDAVHLMSNLVRQTMTDYGVTLYIGCFSLQQH